MKLPWIDLVVSKCAGQYGRGENGIRVLNS